jgi:hypothetical protein
MARSLLTRTSNSSTPAPACSRWLTLVLEVCNHHRNPRFAVRMHMNMDDGCLCTLLTLYRCVSVFVVVVQPTARNSSSPPSPPRGSMVVMSSLVRCSRAWMSSRRSRLSARAAVLPPRLLASRARVSCPSKSIFGQSLFLSIRYSVPINPLTIKILLLFYTAAGWLAGASV